eukprot:scaffold38361_cov19-Prasinocladus_malaysianus.AAC.1
MGGLLGVFEGLQCFSRVLIRAVAAAGLLLILVSGRSFIRLKKSQFYPEACRSLKLFDSFYMWHQNFANFGFSVELLWLLLL